MNTALTKEKKRLFLPDIIKGILVCFVVLGHVIGLKFRGNMDMYWDCPLITFIYSFHMPLFIAMAAFFQGYCPSISFRLFFTKRFKRVGLPIITIACVCFVLDFFVNVTPPDSSMLVKPYLYLSQYWFLDCILILSLCTEVYDILSNKWKYFIWFVYLLLIIFYDSLPYYFFKHLQLIRQWPVYIMAYYIGKYFIRSRDCLCKYRFIMFVISLTVWSLLVAICGYNLLKYTILQRLTIGITSSLVVFIALDYISKWIKNISLLHKLGKNSLGIYIIHIPLFKMFPVTNNWGGYLSIPC